MHVVHLLRVSASSLCYARRSARDDHKPANRIELRLVELLRHHSAGLQKCFMKPVQSLFSLVFRRSRYSRLTDSTLVPCICIFTEQKRYCLQSTFVHDTERLLTGLRPQTTGRALSKLVVFDVLALARGIASNLPEERKTIYTVTAK